MRKRTRAIRLGNVQIGGGAPVSVQAMTKTDTRNTGLTVRQIRRLERAGCDIVRVAVPDMEAARNLASIRRAISIPLVADIHFNYRLALEALRQGVDGLRINPGNIGGADRVKAVVEAARERKVPIRIGVNTGSLSQRILKAYKHPTPEAMVESALEHIRLLEKLRFYDIKVSLKSSDLLETVRAYRLLHRAVRYPLHLGVTAAGPPFSGTIKSALGIGMLLAAGIGDTIRVSLTGSPVEEVRVGREILKALKLRPRGPEIISCPTCGRCRIDIIGMAQTIERELAGLSRDLTIAVMGCAVNGPGEAREADLGIAGGTGGGILFKKGRVVKRLKEHELVPALIREARSL
jgi:(E)-4-hydroxy-3-methylbut-2-enyl-diphosphate synthase